MTRIVGGAAGGRRIAVPPRGTRPTTDRVREALFNVLDARMDLTDMAVLDLYAGSGALGLEALSRGAASALFVESDRRAADVLSGNIAAVGLRGAALRRGTVAAVLAGGTDTPVDLVLADPPYDVDAATIDELPGLLTAGGWAVPGTVVMIERAASSPAVGWPPGWKAWPTRRYGDTRLELAELSSVGC
ncbi:16S rRNA (guanine(966)-N(2))-methyltransferase RsmD [Mycolicibacter arupensis]|uniref:Methyltransferase n=1 Tax=Mycolicibacter arupensis TaxID=342002 RepID=A0A0F5MX25_9MYCO|nr:16S rRNA (guanine(966)-N(2))-methyltransferase RsmD [Mycolicibacter arupensis]KKB99358.1 methyltransferase [Mycolicibacter arupensis]MCV7277428.1 16S rRNA (guanine(966)-N(2))-methyltransferase RsmD [Mycolicibacter arupensis]OQZ98560.1 16S rRNA (guanine(966)-N(2))-methyltransferase RsmD [Mycolicibacter arupensis]